MDAFCVETLQLPPTLRARHGVLRADALAVCEDAMRACALMRQRASDAAAAMQARAQAEAARVLQVEQARLAEQATQLLQALQQAREQLLDGVEALAAGMAAQAFELLVADLAPSERIAAAVRRVRDQAPAKLHEAQAWVHPDDLAALEGGPWPVRPDPRLAPGSCRLEAASGEWVASFELASAALAQAMQARVDTLAAGVQVEDGQTAAAGHEHDDHAGRADDGDVDQS